MKKKRPFQKEQKSYEVPPGTILNGSQHAAPTLINTEVNDTHHEQKKTPSIVQEHD